MYLVYFIKLFKILTKHKRYCLFAKNKLKDITKCDIIFDDFNIIKMSWAFYYKESYVANNIIYVGCKIKQNYQSNV